MMKYGIFLILIILVASCSRTTEDSSEEIINCELLTISTSNLSVEQEFSAQIKGSQDIRIIPKVSGYLEKVNIKEGQQVKKNQLLFVINQTEYQSAVKAAEASLLQAEAMTEKAKHDYEGKLKLREKNVISEFDLQQTQRDLAVAEANKEAAEAELDKARNDLEFTRLKSPSDGITGSIPYRVGDFVGPDSQQGLTIVSDNNNMYVYFSISETSAMNYLADYGSMQKAIEQMPELKLILAGGKEYSHKGKIESISGIIDENTGSVSVRAVFPNPEGILLSGGTGRVLMPITYTNAIVIPQEATFEIQDKIFVYKVENGRTKSAIITVQKINDGKQYVVTNGLEKGDIIVAKGAGLLREGTLVEKTNE